MMPKIIKFTDETPFPFGKHEGVIMQNVPAEDLIWMYENYFLSKPVRDYIEDNRDVLDSEIKESKKWK